MVLVGAHSIAMKVISHRSNVSGGVTVDCQYNKIIDELQESQFLKNFIGENSAEKEILTD